MAITDTTITWARPRVQNFTEEYAHRLIHELVALDGRVFDKVAFFDHLVTNDVLHKPSIPEGKSHEEIYAKRWDSYLAPIRPYGLGFNIEEKRTDSPNPPKRIWRVSSIARAFDDGELSHREFMAVQLARTQFPNITMPLRDPAKTELMSGAAIMPFRLFLEVANGLAASDEPPYLTRAEVCQLARCHTHDDVPYVIAEIVRHRNGEPTPLWVQTEPNDLDILVNELDATRFWRKTPTGGIGDHPILLPRHATFAAARAVALRQEWIDVTSDEGIEAYYARLNSMPNIEDLSILRRRPQIIKFAVGEVVLIGSELTGSADRVGGLAAGDRALLSGYGRLVEITAPAEMARRLDRGWVCTASVEVVAHRL